MHVEDIAVLHTLDDTDGNVDERIFVQHKQPVVWQRNDSIGSCSTEVLDTFPVQLLERNPQSFVITLDRLLGVDLADKYRLQSVLVGSAAIDSTANYAAVAVCYLSNTSSCA